MPEKLGKHVTFLPHVDEVWNVGSEGWLRGNVLIAQACRLEFRSAAPTSKLGAGASIYSHSQGTQRWETPWGSLSHQPDWTDESSETDVVQRDPGRHSRCPLASLCAFITVWTCTETTSTHVYPYAKFKGKLQAKILLDNLEYRYKFWFSNF